MANSLNVYDVQQALRRHAEKGLDVTNPHGLMLHGKMYPSLYGTRLSMFGEHNQHHEIESTIPLESGHVIRLGSRNEMKHVEATLWTPFTKEGAVPGKDDYKLHMYHEHPETSKVKLTPENVHETIKTFSSLPFRGRIHRVAGNDREDDEVMEPKHLSEHLKANLSIPHPPYVLASSTPHGVQSPYFNEEMRVEIPRGQIHVRAGHADEHYAYDPVNETLKRAEQ